MSLVGGATGPVVGVVGTTRCAESLVVSRLLFGRTIVTEDARRDRVRSWMIGV